MSNVFGWVLFGFAVWGLVILLHALQRRFAPDLEHDENWGFGSGRNQRRHQRRENNEPDPRDEEIAQLKKRIETLEAIVTDKKFQFDQELNRS